MGACLATRLRLLALLAALLVAEPALAQTGLVVEGMITPSHPTSAAEVVVVRARTEDQLPAVPMLLSDRRRIVLSSHAAPGGSPLELVSHRVGRLRVGEWSVEEYGIDWPVAGGTPQFAGFSDPGSFYVTPGEVGAKSGQPMAGEAFELLVEGQWRNSCVPRLNEVKASASEKSVVVSLRRTDSMCLPESDDPVTLALRVPVPALPPGAYAITVEVPDLALPSVVEVYAANTVHVVAAGEPRVVGSWLEADPEREVHQVVVEAEVPNRSTGATCRSWEVRPHVAFAHGRDVYARFALEETAAACGPSETVTYRLPVAGLETGLYRVHTQRSEPSDEGAFSTWSQSSRLHQAEQLAHEIDGRFRVSVAWRDGKGGRGLGAPVPFVASSGQATNNSSAIFTFFGENNWEVLVKVLNGCAINSHYWVFASASTDVEYTLTVLDTATGKSAVYQNLLGQASPAVTDTNALAVCG